jgi:starch-binding outer membrane protein, SusD/RagB family
MKNNIIKSIAYLLPFLFLVACEDDFLERSPLDTPSLETFWETPAHAEMWVNNLYTGLPTVDDTFFEGYSDNAYGRAGGGANSIANGLFDTNDPKVRGIWNYRTIRLSLEFFENVGKVPNMPQNKLEELSGQVHFMLAYQYFRLITLFRDVPLVKEPLSIDASDVPKNSKEEVLAYILEQLDLAVSKLPVTWPASESGRFTKGGALALKARVMLYNNRWAEAAAAAKQVMDLNVYELHPNFGELFLGSFNNKTKEIIVARQYAENVNTHNIVRDYAPVYLGGFALVLPTDELQASFEMADGSKFDWSNPVHAANPFDNRDPRFYETFTYHGRDYNGVKVDLTGSEFRFAFTYIYYLKYVADLKNRFWPSHVNWIILRYADVLLMYAEAQNEASGPDESVYEVLDQIRTRAGMPPVDRSLYNSQASLREFIRNERRVELAGEGHRYYDIIRWRIAEQVLNKSIKSMDLTQWVNHPLDANGNQLLPVKPVQTRIFNPAKHYVWPIPQNAIDRATNLEQHPEWK